MYAVMETGGKQYRVAAGDRLRIEKINAQPGDTVKFDKVLMVTADDRVSVGKPYLSGASVTGEVLEQGRDKKILVFKYKNKSKQSRKLTGHRQSFTNILINDIAFKA
ncbi:MAG: 50S ribosomal protein L21 [Synergistota bacterium]|nr:50S ribosomal protein L21 [Synergistota bacterium]